MKRLIPLFFSFLLLLAIPGQAKKDKEYLSVLHQWTRHGEVYSKQDLAAGILWDATNLNTEMTGAQAKIYAKKYALSESDRNTKWDALNSANKGRPAFFVSFFSNDKKFYDLTKPDHGWQVTLENNGRKYQPVSIEKVKRPSPETRLYFPYLTHWSIGYWVYFPVGALQNGESNFSLDLRNPNFHSTLHW